MNRHTSVVLPKSWFLEVGLFCFWSIMRSSFDLCESRNIRSARNLLSAPARDNGNSDGAPAQVPRELVARPTPRPPPPRRRSLKPRRHHPRHRGCGTRHLASLRPPTFPVVLFCLRLCFCFLPVCFHTRVWGLTFTSARVLVRARHRWARLATHRHNGTTL